MNVAPIHSILTVRGDFHINSDKRCNHNCMYCIENTKRVVHFVNQCLRFKYGETMNEHFLKFEYDDSFKPEEGENNTTFTLTPVKYLRMSVPIRNRLDIRLKEKYLDWYQLKNIESYSRVWGNYVHRRCIKRQNNRFRIFCCWLFINQLNFPPELCHMIIESYFLTV